MGTGTGENENVVAGAEGAATSAAETEASAAETETSTAVGMGTDIGRANPRVQDHLEVDAKGRPLAIVPATVPWLAVAVFVAVAVVLAWLICLPLWISDEGLQDVLLVQLCGQAMMFTPLLSVIVAMIVQRRRVMRRGAPQPSIPRYLGMWPLRPFGRVLGVTAASLFGVFVLVAAAYLLGSAFGWVTFDLTGLSGFKMQMAALPGMGMIPLPAAVIVYLVIMVFNSLVTAIFAFGEEVGWRGWLLTSLRPLGTWPALLIVGVVWGLWHAPLILLGYNFSRPDITGLGFMIGGCVMIGVLLGWLRLRTGSVWPAVFAHGGLNGSSAMLLGLFIDAAAPTPDMALIATLGVAGWIVSALVIAVLLATGQFRRQPELGIKRPKPPKAVTTPAPAPSETVSPATSDGSGL
ncbi:hypothetical protein GCM10009813_25100 [Brevibacterium marinum]